MMELFCLCFSCRIENFGLYVIGRDGIVKDHISSQVLADSTRLHRECRQLVGVMKVLADPKHEDEEQEAVAEEEHEEEGFPVEESFMNNDTEDDENGDPTFNEQDESSDEDEVDPRAAAEARRLELQRSRARIIAEHDPLSQSPAEVPGASAPAPARGEMLHPALEILWLQPLLEMLWLRPV
jgi:hypothetical protein